MVSHNDVRTHERLAQQTGPQTAFELVVEVTFVWSYPAKSAFVTGTFSNWETTVPMTQITNSDGTHWVLSKPLPPGDYQYKCSYPSNLAHFSLFLYFFSPFSISVMSN